MKNGHLNLGELYLNKEAFIQNKKAYECAWTQLNKAKLGPGSENYGRVQYLRGLIRERQGNPVSALRYYRKAEARGVLEASEKVLKLKTALDAHRPN